MKINRHRITPRAILEIPVDGLENKPGPRIEEVVGAEDSFFSQEIRQLEQSTDEGEEG